MTGAPPLHLRRPWIIALLLALALLLGFLAVKRTVNGNADLSGNHRLWRVNLSQSTLPVRREGPQPQDPDAYPPITYALFAPLGALPIGATATVWYLLNLGCSVYLWRSARNWLTTAAGRPPGRRPELLEGAAILAVLPWWIGSVLLGQNTLLLMSMTWGAFQAAQRRQDWLAGGLLGLATSIKILPVVFLLPFVFTRNWRALSAFSLTILLLVGGLGSLYFGPQTNLEFHRKWATFVIRGPENRPEDPSDPNTLRGSLRYHNQAIEAVLARLLMDVPIHNRPDAPRVNLLNVSAATWRISRAIVSGFCVLIGLSALARAVRAARHSTSNQSALIVPPPIGPATRDRQTGVEIYAILCLLQLFVSPIVWSHYYLWLFWPILLVLVQTDSGRRSGIIITLGWFASLPLIAIPQVRAIGLHLGMTLVIYLWICWPLIRGQRRGNCSGGCAIDVSVSAH